MSTFARALLLSAMLILAASAFGQVNIINFDFGAVLVQCGNGYAYQGAVTSCPYGYNTQDFDQSPGFGWILGAVAARQLAPTSCWLRGCSGGIRLLTMTEPARFAIRLFLCLSLLAWFLLPAAAASGDRAAGEHGGRVGGAGGRLRRGAGPVGGRGRRAGSGAARARRGAGGGVAVGVPFVIPKL